MVRIDFPADRPRGEPLSRLVVGYNDTTDAMIPASSGCYRFADAGASIDGWAYSDDFGGPWKRQPKLTLTPSLREFGINVRHGDPWLAAYSCKMPYVPGIVLYVDVAQHGTDPLGFPFYVLLSRSRDSGKTFADHVPILGPVDFIPDGPKVALTGDGLAALVAWTRAGRFQYKLVWDLQAATMHFSPNPIDFDPRENAEPPHPSCTGVSGFRHPHVAAGYNSFYFAGEFSYFGCPGGTETRIEVHRNTSIGLAFGAKWQRILSVRAPPNVTGPFRGLLNVQDVAGTPRFGAHTDRGDILPALAVGQDEQGEFVIVVTEQVQAGVEPQEAHREKLIHWRIPAADVCDAHGHKKDLDTCGVPVPAQELDSISTPSDMRTVRSRRGLWASKPAVFTGKTPDRTIDKRVGIVWYAQPYKGRLDATDEMRTRTIIEAAISKDGGKTYSGPFNLTVATERDGIFEEPDIGAFFYPCQILCTGYYGEYISGAFQFADPGLEAIVAAWGDSREGCTDQSHATQHHHVWAGALRARRTP